MAQIIGSQELKRIIEDGDAKELVIQSKSFGEQLAKDALSSSQIRGVFGTVKQIEVSWNSTEPRARLRKLLLLQPRLAYQAKRHEKARPLAEVLTQAIGMVADAKDDHERTQRFGYFVDLFEAILAYHTAAGGR